LGLRSAGAYVRGLMTRVVSGGLIRRAFVLGVFDPGAYVRRLMTGALMSGGLSP